MAEKQRSVKMVLLTNIPTMGGLVAILQARGTFNHEEMGLEFWPGGCHVTVKGGVMEGEGFFSALLKGTAEELGDKVYGDLQNLMRTNQLVILNERWSPEKDTPIYGMIIPPEMIADFRLGPSSGGLRFVGQDGARVIGDLREIEEDATIPNGYIAMFPDEKQAVLLAFEKLAPKNGIDAMIISIGAEQPPPKQ